MVGQIWVPPLENNQGTLSLIAIALALFFWIWDKFEHNRRETREIEDALELFIEAEHTLVQLSEADTDEEAETGLEELALLANALRMSASSHMNRSLFALACLRGAQIIEEGLKQQVLEDADEAEAACERLVEQRKQAANAAGEAQRRKHGRARSERKIKEIVNQMDKG